MSVLSLVFLLGIFSGGVRAESPKYRTIPEEELQRILKAHKEWLKSDGKSGKRADLSHISLRNKSLQKADLRRADLQWVNLQWAELQGAKFQGADLSYARLEAAKLHGAKLQGARLQGAKLWWTNLQRANLQGVNLDGANLKNADFWGANLAGTIYEPEPGSLPRIQHMANAKNLSKMTFLNKPIGLVELRQAFKNAGLRDEERQITFAIKYKERIKTWKEGGIANVVESLLNLIFFELTSNYGMTPMRPLGILGSLILGFSAFYWIAIRLREDRSSGIWAIPLQDRVLDQEMPSKGVRITSHSSLFRSAKQTRLKSEWYLLLYLVGRFFRVIWIGFYFSVLSSFRIGWRELNIANWISRIQFREYNLRATGWVRTVSGIQSLISVYLIALWVLTYFGRPFE